MISPKHINALHKLDARLKGTDVNWVIIGSCALALQGLPVEVHDIDILTDKAGAFAIERLLSENVADRVILTDPEENLYCGKLRIEGLEVEIIGELEKRQGSIWVSREEVERHKRYAEIEGMRMPVLSVECECEAYLRLGRLDKVQLIQEWLKRKGDDFTCGNSMKQEVA